MRVRGTASIFFLSLMSLIVSTSAQAYYSTLETADTLPANGYSMGLEPQYIFDNIAGGNVVAHFDMGVNDESSMRFVLGSGTTTFQGGAFYKIIPIPDYQNQPGLGAFGGILYANINGVSVLTFRIHPLISKSFQTVQSGVFTPYMSIPFGIALESGTNFWPVQIEGGLKWLPPSVRHMNFWFELGVNVNDAFSYVSLGLTVPFDSWDNIRFD